MHKRPADVITGWNVYHFDLVYLVNRSKKLFGEETKVYHKLSPINNVRSWETKDGDLNIDIAGVNILDYMDIFKWYSPDKLEQYTLDFVSSHVLKTGKLKYDFDDLKELYENDWQTYVEYNIVDVDLVDKLEDSLGYIRLVQALSLLTKCPMKFYAAMTQLIEGALLTYYRRNQMCAPALVGGKQKHFPAAYVKEPQKGMHEWLIDIDIASSYPAHIIALNMSTETYFGRILDFTYDVIAKYTRKRDFPEFHFSKFGHIKHYKNEDLEKFNSALDRGLLAIAPCGSVFTTSKPGVIAAVEKAIFYKRKDIKDHMKILRNSAAKMEKCPEQSQKLERANELFSLQWAVKILLNAMFGITAVPYSRYFNTNIAEAITSCGRHTILQSEKFINEYFAAQGVEEDMVAYIDTDSLFIRLGHYFEGMEDFENADDQGKIAIILSFSAQLEKMVNDRIFHETQIGDYNSQVHDFKIMFKQEIIAKTALFVKKKKYAYWVVNDEGTPTDKLAVKGLEIVRSDSAEAIRTRLKHVYELIMKKAPEEELKETIKKYKAELYDVTPEEIAANIGVNNINKYLQSGRPMKGTPWHVKGVHNYRLLLKNFGLESKYEDIHEGVKAKVVYLKRNPYLVETVTFQKWPEEFSKRLAINYELMIDKFFVKKIGFLLEPMNKMDLLNTESKGFDLYFS
jgi:DNA polymerase elongation subunit (family B)